MSKDIEKILHGCFHPKEGVLYKDIMDSTQTEENPEFYV